MGATGLRLIGGSAMAMAALWLGAPARAQEAAPNAGDPAPEAEAPAAAEEGRNPDIIVTATRREERLQDVPVAVTAFGEEAIQALSAETVGELASFAPNLSRTSGPTGGNDAFFFIRGIGQVDSNPAADPGVGVYVDGVYFGRLQGSSIDTDDIARVEVLRGPQGTLFGRNTIGGAISITTKDPGRDFGTQGRVTYGSRDRIDAYAAADLPVSEQFRLRISGATRNQDGWGKNVYTGETFGDVENLSGRVRALWEPDPDVRLALTADAVRGRGSSAHTILVGFNPAAGPIPGTTPLGVPFPPLLQDTSPDIDVSFASIEPRNDLDSWGLSGDLGWTLGENVGLRLIVAYRELDQFVTNDFDGTGFKTFDNFFDTGTNQLSGELQLSGEALAGRLEWLLGFYGFRERIDHNNAICLGANLGGPFAFARNQGGCLQNNQRFGLDVDSWALFAHTTIALSDEFGLILGGRYTNEEKEQRFDFFLDNRAGVFSFFGIPPIILPTLSPSNPALTIPTTYKGSWSRFTPKLGFEWEPQEDLLVYGSWSRGFKSGGFNGRPSPNPTGGFNQILPYDPETLDAWELGFKSDLADNRLRLNAAAFYSIYDGIQLLVLDPTTGFFNTQNAGKNEIWGFEVEATARPVDPLTIYANIGYVHDRYKELNPLAVGIDLGDRLPVTPRWTLATGANYHVALGGAGTLDLRGDLSFRDEVWYGAPNNPLEREEAITLLNLRATWRDPSDRFSVALFGTNVTNVRYYSNVQDVRGALGVAFAQVAPPREWGVELGFRF
ncbi:MAG: TonB-dependent receptor [Allosphingosinicella sp.]